MSKTVQPIVEDLFASHSAGGATLDFSWRLIKRKQRPFLLLPDSAKDMRVSLELYSAQRRRAKIWRALLPWLFKTPAAGLFPKVSLRAGADLEIIRFLSEQSGVPVEQLRAPAIKFGGLALHKSRLVLLVCDQTNRPVKVIKLGLNDEGRTTTEREADLLEKLPANTLGCIRLTGRLTTEKISAFATSYFPGESPEDDAGLETLFHSWLNAGPAEAVENFVSWRELETIVAQADPAAWRSLRGALAGRTLRSTLHHGDFAPWNVRAINSQNLQAFDWERGNIHGLPGWDWFHFITQTSILARRHSVERVAAEIEELIRSARFEKYAAAAGISPMVKPLMLAYLLHHRWVVQPLEGGATVMELFHLLAAHWRFAARPEISAAPAAPAPGLWADAVRQLKSATAPMANLFWEPTLNSKTQPTMGGQFSAHWPVMLVSFLLFTAVAGAHCYASTHLIFLPFYLAPIVLMTVRVDRRWGAFVATVAAIIGPVIQSYRDEGFHHMDVGLWNIVMRFITLQMCVFFVDRIRKQGSLFGRRTLRSAAGKFSECWAVVVAAAGILAAIFVADYLTNPHLSFIPIYLIPCMMLTLALNVRWGIAATVIAAVVGSLAEYLTNPSYQLAEIFGWNLLMRFFISSVVILMLERIRAEDILFFSRRENGGAKTPARG